MEEIVNKDFKVAVKSAIVKKGTSKDGNDYYYLSLEFVNGYEHRVFLRSDNIFAFKDALARVSHSEEAKKDFWN